MLDSHPSHIGLLAAMPEELGLILKNLKDIKEKKSGDLIIYSGLWKNYRKEEIFISTAWSGWGKVSAARATTKLIDFTHKNKLVDFLLFTGVAGAACKNLKQWDIVVADSVMQHDMDARPIYKEFVIPALNSDKMIPNNNLKNILIKSLKNEKSKGGLKGFGSIYEGLIATGDNFITDKIFLDKLKIKLPKLLAVEMEGGAFAQVAEQENFKWILLRVISDSANNSADNDFNLFIKEYKNKSWELIELFLNSFY